MKVYKGFTASPGLVLGQVSRLDRPPLVFGEGPFHPEQEKQALEDAIKVAQQELDEMAGRAAPSEQAIFLFQSMMLEDEGFMNEVAFQIKAGVGAAEAMDRVGHRYAAQLAAMKDNAYMQLRSVDILDVTQRITNILCHRIRSWLALDHPVILASDLLMPTDLFSVPAGRILPPVGPPPRPHHRRGQRPEPCGHHRPLAEHPGHHPGGRRFPERLRRPRGHPERHRG